MVDGSDHRQAPVTGSGWTVTGHALAGAWALLVVSAGYHRRPSARSRPVNRPSTGRLAVLAAITVAVLLVVPPLAPLVAAGAWLVPRAAERRARLAAERAVVDALPDTVDLFVLAVASGANVGMALTAVAPRAPPPLGGALTEIRAMVDRGHRLADAIETLPARVGEPGRGLSTVLAASVRYGAPVGPSLERLAGEVRLDRRRRAEEAARRVPVQLLFPLVLFILPAFAALTVVPLLAGTLDGLRP